MKLTYLGHSAFIFEAGSQKCIIDPFIKDNPLCNIKLSDLGNIDYILVTHGHSDHMGDTVEIAKKYGSTVICNFEISIYLDKYNIKCHPMHIGGSYDFDFGRVKMVPALHGSSILEGNHIIPAGSPCGFIVHSQGKKIYHAGDTGLSMEMSLLKRENIDIALLPVGGNFTMDIDDAIYALRLIQPKLVIPMHYDTFPMICCNTQNFEKLAKDICNVQLLKPMESMIY